MRNTRTKTWSVAAVALGVMLALAASPALAQGRDECARAVIPWSTTLPDGSIQHAGTMRLCLQRMYTPAAGLHEIQIDGSPIGLFMSRIQQSEGRYSEEPVLIFLRDAEGQHTLVGYAWPDGDAMQTYLLHEFGKPPSRVARTDLPVGEETNTRVLVAAETF